MSKKLDYKESLEYVNPDIAAEWHPTKNSELNPSMVFANSNKKAWWLGRCGHEWDAVIATRNKGVGCPFCSNRKVLKGFNDLTTTNSDIAAEWHPTKNGDLTPYDVTSGSEKIVWWLGKCGHEWQQRIPNRKHGGGCPYCKNSRISQSVSKNHIFRSGSLADTNPELLVEWHPTKNIDISPTELTQKSDRVIWWLGKCGHEWQARPSSRVSGAGCPYCSNQKVLPGFNDFASHFPEIAAEWHPTKNGELTPDQVTSGSNKKVWWLGKCGHEWEQTVHKRTGAGRGCPICAQKLQTSFPEQAFCFYIRKVFLDAENSYQGLFDGEMELDIYIPSISVGIEYDGANWHTGDQSDSRERLKYEICKNNGVKLIRLREDIEDADMYYCDYCIGVKRHPKFAELDNEIKELLQYLQCNDPVEVNTERDGIAIRSQYITGSSEESFLLKYPELAEYWDYEKNGSLNPEMFSVSSGTRVWWKCKTCGHEWNTRIADQTRNVHCCPQCAIKLRTRSGIINRAKKIGSIADHYPELLNEWDYEKNTEFQPSELPSSTNIKVWWKCTKCNCEWEASINQRKKDTSCPKCAGRV